MYNPASHLALPSPEFSTHERRALQDGATILEAHNYPLSDFSWVLCLFAATDERCVKDTESNSAGKEGVLV